MEIKNKKIMILAPHTDDGELGCGATISMLGEENEIFYVAFHLAKGHYLKVLTLTHLKMS